MIMIDETFTSSQDNENIPSVSSEPFDLERAAFMLYTSGTT